MTRCAEKSNIPQDFTFADDAQGMVSHAVWHAVCCSTACTNQCCVLHQHVALHVLLNACIVFGSWRFGHSCPLTPLFYAVHSLFRPVSAPRSQPDRLNIFADALCRSSHQKNFGHVFSDDMLSTQMVGIAARGVWRVAMSSHNLAPSLPFALQALDLFDISPDVDDS